MNENVTQIYKLILSDLSISHSYFLFSLLPLAVYETTSQAYCHFLYCSALRKVASSLVRFWFSDACGIHTNTILVAFQLGFSMHNTPISYSLCCLPFLFARRKSHLECCVLAFTLFTFFTLSLSFTLQALSFTAFLCLLFLRSSSFVVLFFLSYPRSLSSLLFLPCCLATPLTTL